MRLLKSLLSVTFSKLTRSTPWPLGAVWVISLLGFLIN